MPVWNKVRLSKFKFREDWCTELHWNLLFANTITYATDRVNPLILLVNIGQTYE